ncbi:hypothetical protein [Bacillus sp. EAC]|uniref:hypothetical protein n=1 Tax=Bacillus sp. EAC TaxID=1978338 RepID=UPI000B450DF7|nr:hypothetical protein [Bacillus sp. EAC]
MAEVKSKMGIKKNLILLLVLILVFIFLAISAPKVQNTYKPTLQGTYLCEKLPFATLVFDEKDDHAFYYYNFTGSDEVTEKGKYSKETDKTYVIDSNSFQNVIINYDGKGRSFKIHINNGIYVFKQFSPLPSIITNNYE